MYTVSSRTRQLLKHPHKSSLTACEAVLSDYRGEPSDHLRFTGSACGRFPLDPWTSRIVLNAGQLEIRDLGERLFQFRRFQDRLPAAAHKLNVELVLSTLADLPYAE